MLPLYHLLALNPIANRFIIGALSAIGIIHLSYAADLTTQMTQIRLIHPLRTCTIEDIRQTLSFFEISPTILKIFTHEVTFKARDKYELGVSSDNMTIHAGKCIIPTAKDTVYPLVAPQNGDFFISIDSGSKKEDVLCKFYYGENCTHDCKCSFWVTMSPVYLEPNTIGYHHTLCSCKLTLKQIAPLSVDGLENPPFCNLTALTIRECAKLSGTGGALANILAVMKKLKKLDLADTQLDETIIDVEHEELEQLNLKNCNCTDIRRIVMPKLWLLNLDYNPLPPIMYSYIKVTEWCLISTQRKMEPNTKGNC